MIICTSSRYLYRLSVFGLLSVVFFFSSRRRHTRCALVTGVQTCALPIYKGSRIDFGIGDEGDGWRVRVTIHGKGPAQRLQHVCVDEPCDDIVRQFAAVWEAEDVGAVDVVIVSIFSAGARYGDARQDVSEQKVSDRQSTRLNSSH